jgi:hypothetical protein
MQRFPLFWRRLQVFPDHASKIIMRGVYLHNFIINFDGNEKILSLFKTAKQHKYFVFFQNELSLGTPFNCQESNCLREDLVQRLKRLGIVRLHFN